MMRHAVHHGNGLSAGLESNLSTVQPYRTTVQLHVIAEFHPPVIGPRRRILRRYMEKSTDRLQRQTIHSLYCRLCSREMMMRRASINLQQDGNVHLSPHAHQAPHKPSSPPTAAHL